MDQFTAKNMAIKALEGMKGDDLFRAKARFARMDYHQMNSQYGMSGQTPKMILDGYESRDREIDEAIAIIRKLQ